MIGISLNQDVSCEHICKTIQRLVENYRAEHSDLKDTMLILNITKTIEATTQNQVLHLDHH